LLVFLLKKVIDTLSALCALCVHREEQQQTTTTMTTEISKDNIAKESYYNLCRLAEITGYANPIAALRVTNETFHVTKDECGNII